VCQRRQVHARRGVLLECGARIVHSRLTGTPLGTCPGRYPCVRDWRPVRGCVVAWVVIQGPACTCGIVTRIGVLVGLCEVDML
jgi:hypothetical protein